MLAIPAFECNTRKMRKVSETAQGMIDSIVCQIIREARDHGTRDCSPKKGMID
jgi:hypothetical protein